MAGSNSPFGSSSGVSSLLRSASSAAQKINDFEDAMIAYDWNNSPKTSADFMAYEDYLKGRMASTANPMDQLSIQKKIDSAYSGYVSNEIQRQTIDVIEGSSTNMEKYGRMTSLYYQAAGAGQFDLAQNLRLQLDNLSVTIQNEQMQKITSDKEVSRAFAESIDNQVKDAEQTIKDNARVLVDEYSKLGANQFKQVYGSDIFSALTNMVNSPDPNNPGLVQIYQQAMGITTDPSKKRTYQEAFNKMAQGGETGIKLPGVGSVTVKDLQDQAYADSIGQSFLEGVQTGKGVLFKKNQITGYQYGRDETGNYTLMPLYGSDTSLKTTTPDPAGPPKVIDLGKKLKDAKFEFAGYNTVVNRGEFDSAGIGRGQQVQVYVGADGRLQIVNGGKSYSLNFDQKTQKYVGLEENSPDVINSLPGAGEKTYSRFNNRYFAAQLEKNPNFFNELPPGAIGLVDMSRASFQPGMLMGEANQRQFQIQPQKTMTDQQLQPAVGAQTLQPAVGAQFLQGAVNPMNLPANTTIGIAQPKSLQAISLGMPKLPTITSTSSGAPQPKITVGSAPGQTLSVGAVSQPTLRTSW